MAKSQLCKADVDFLIILAELGIFLTYPEIVKIHFEKVKTLDSSFDEAKERNRIYVNFRQAKCRIKKMEAQTGYQYILEKSKMFMIHPEAVEKPRTCAILLEFILAKRGGLREVRKGDFEKYVAEKYKNSTDNYEWSEDFVRARVDDARRNGYISFDEFRNEYIADERLKIDELLILRIVEGVRNDSKTSALFRVELEKLLSNF